MTLTTTDAEVVFATLPAPETLRGRFAARAQTLPGTATLPAPLRRLALVIVNAVVSILYRGKEFHVTCGANLWALGKRRVPFEFVHDRDCVRISYDLPENPAAVRRIVSEVREQSPQRQLCRLSIRTRTGTRTLLYFTLEPRP